MYFDKTDENDLWVCGIFHFIRLFKLQRKHYFVLFWEKNHTFVFNFTLNFLVIILVPFDIFQKVNTLFSRL